MSHLSFCLLPRYACDVTPSAFLAAVFFATDLARRPGFFFANGLGGLLRCALGLCPASLLCGSNACAAFGAHGPTLAGLPGCASGCGFR